MNPIPANQPGVNDGDVRAFAPGGNGFDLNAARFSLANARVMALYARRAYTEATISDDATDTQILIEDVGNCIVVAPRGTSDPRDFITDAQAWMTYVPEFDAWMHAGLAECWRAIRNRLIDYLAPNRTKPILVGGHSLGGLLAFPIAKSLRGLLFNVHSVYNFGAPRPADAKFQKSYNAQAVPGSPFENLGAATFTLIHDCDIVPRVPGYLSGYRRPGRDEFISSLSHDIWEDPSVPLRIGSDVYSLARSWFARRGWLALDQIITDHHVDNYIAALNAAEPRASLGTGEAA